MDRIHSGYGQDDNYSSDFMFVNYWKHACTLTSVLLNTILNVSMLISLVIDKMSYFRFTCLCLIPERLYSSRRLCCNSRKRRENRLLLHHHLLARELAPQASTRHPELLPVSPAILHRALDHDSGLLPCARDLFVSHE